MIILKIIETVHLFIQFSILLFWLRYNVNIEDILSEAKKNISIIGRYLRKPWIFLAQTKKLYISIM